MKLSLHAFVAVLVLPVAVLIISSQTMSPVQAQSDTSAIMAATECTPHPQVQTAPAPSGGALQVHIEATPLNTSQPNLLRGVRFGTFQNAQVTLNGQLIASGATFTALAGSNAVDFTVERALPGQAMTVPLTILDGCGEWPTFVGAGTDAQVVRPAVAPQPVVLLPSSDRGHYAPGNTLILYGDMVVGAPGPTTCKLESRFRPGQGVVFRMTALNPAEGTFDETAQLEVRIPYGPDGVNLKMDYRGDDTDRAPRPGFWTVRWNVPLGAQPQTLRFTVHATDAQGRTGTWAPFDIARSTLKIVN